MGLTKPQKNDYLILILIPMFQKTAHFISVPEHKHNGPVRECNELVEQKTPRVKLPCLIQSLKHWPEDKGTSEPARPWYKEQMAIFKPQRRPTNWLARMNQLVNKVNQYAPSM